LNLSSRRYCSCAQNRPRKEIDMTQEVGPKSVVAVAAGCIAIGLIGVGAVAAATSVPGSVAGSVISVAGSTLTIKTIVTSTGKSKVKLNSKTAITKQAAGTRANLKIGDCVRASGTASSSDLEAAQVVITGTSSSQCAGGFGGGNGPRQSTGA